MVEIDLAMISFRIFAPVSALIIFITYQKDFTSNKYWKQILTALMSLLIISSTYLAFNTETWNIVLGIVITGTTLFTAIRIDQLQKEIIESSDNPECIETYVMITMDVLTLLLLGSSLLNVCILIKDKIL